nr:MAG TPA: NinG protein [Caudoviricetes sp.]
MMLKRICDICGRTVKQGKPCPCRVSRHRDYDIMRRDKNKAAFYHGKAWQRTAEAARRRAQYADEVVFAETGRFVRGNIVHHIEPIGENPARKLDMENLIFVSAQTHKKIHDAYNKNPRAKREMQERLTAIRRKRDEAGAGQKSFEQEI